MKDRWVEKINRCKDGQRKKVMDERTEKNRKIQKWIEKQKLMEREEKLMDRWILKIDRQMQR